MNALQRIGELFGFRPRGVSAYLQMIDPSAGVLSAIDEFAIAPYMSGREAVLVYQRMFDTDTHLEGLYRRISIAILSSKIEVSCDDEEVQRVVRGAMGIVEGAPPTRFLRFCNELTSSLQYGFSLHEKMLDNDDMGSKIRLRRVEPIDVHEFTVDGDDLVSAAETYQQEVHGVETETRMLRGRDGRDIEVVDIPAERLLHIAPLQLGRNYFGRSLFRAAIGTWAYKVIYLFCDAIRQGRFSVPLLIAKLDQFSERPVEDTDVLQKVFKLPATAINRMLIMRKDDEVQAVSPDGNTELMGSVRYIDFSHSKLVLEQFVDVGDKAWGSRSTYTAGSDDFYDSLNFYEMAMLAGVHEHATDIARANFTSPPPIRAQFKEMGIGRQRIASLWGEMVEKKTVRRGKEDEPWLRTAVGAPEYVEPDEGDLAPMDDDMDDDMDENGMPPGMTTNGAPVHEEVH